MKRTATRIALCLAWLIGVGAGIVALANYDNAAGRVGNVLRQWPAEAPVALDATRATLVMFAHPQCPCTRASIGELNRLLARSEGRVAVHVFFLRPAGQSEAWTQSETWRDAAALPGVTVHADPDGAVARRFGAGTSGQVFLFNRAGELLFAGGITASRAHAGDNAGENMIVALLAGGRAEAGQAPVFGCSLGGNSGATSRSGAEWTK